MLMVSISSRQRVPLWHLQNRAPGLQVHSAAASLVTLIQFAL